MGKSVWLAVIVTVVLLAIALAACRVQDKQPDFYARLGTVEYDVVYATVDGVDLKMDIHYPRVASGRVPAVLWVHGGGWTSGDKRVGAGTPYLPELLSRGYLVASVNYRLAPDYKINEQIGDVKAAVRFLRANARAYGIDTERIGALGSSAGGHLVALLGTSDAKAGLEGKGGNPGQSSRVQAVVDLFGPADFALMFRGAGPVQLARLFGVTTLDSTVVTNLSPVNHITHDDPPFLILHGDRDATVPLEQSQVLQRRLEEAGVPATLMVVSNAGHGFRPTPDGATISPSQADLTRLIADFFDKELGE